MDKEKPTVSFITINYNGLKDTCELIDSILRTVQSVTYDIMVVDNDSIEDEATLIRKRYAAHIEDATSGTPQMDKHIMIRCDITIAPSVTVDPKYPKCLALRTFRNSKNIGFPAANNVAICHSEGQYLFLINNDAYLEEDGLPFLIERLDSEHNMLGVSPKIRFAAPPHLIQYAGYTRLSNITLRNKTIGYGKEDNGDYDVAHPVPYMHGAAMMVKTRMQYAIGDMPDVFFLYYEEMDWSALMTEFGYTLWYEPRCTVFHKEAQSTGGGESVQRTFYMTRNRLLFAFRNLRWYYATLSIAYQITIAASKNSLRYLFKRRPDLAAAVWRGVYAFIVLPKKTY